MRTLRRLLDDRQAVADELHDQHDYAAEFPAGEAEALQYAVDHLSLDGPLTFSARYFKQKFESLADPSDERVVRALVAATGNRSSVFTSEQFDAMKVVLKAAWGERCQYPTCNCPFDNPGTKDWCARGLPK